MNRRRMIKKKDLSFGQIILLAVAVLLVATAGVHFVYLKNKQIDLVREIEHTKNRIAEHEYDLRGLQSREDDILDRYLIRDRLRLVNSTMVEIPAEVIEHVDSIIDSAPRRGILVEAHFNE